VLSGGKLLFEVPIEGPATAVERYEPSAAAPAGSRPSGRVIYGTEGGCVGEVHAEGGALSVGWQINPALEGRRGKSAGVSCLHSEDMTKDGVADILIGREDGMVEVWSFDVGDGPKLAFERNLHESVTGIGCGAVSNSNFDEVIVSTYSGQIVAFSSEPGQVEAGGASDGRKEPSERRVAKMLAELDSLSAQVDRERAARNGSAAPVGEVKLRDKWTLSADEACYNLSLEMAVPLEGVLLQCDVPVEMVEASGAIASRSPMVDGKAGLLVSFRCHELTNRIELRMRTSEGRYGQLQAFVWPRISPKTCAVASYAIKPLSLHTRLAAPPVELPALSTLRIKGSFTVEQMHSWVAACLPEVPARLAGETGSVAFRSTFLGTLLLCDYAKGEASFRSDSLTALAIVKEVVSKEATVRKVQIQINVGARQETVPELLRKIDPLMQ
jgi:Bardet-Biedl syndrome 7 protein